MADALDSKSSDRKVVWVRLPPSVLQKIQTLTTIFSHSTLMYFLFAGDKLGTGLGLCRWSFHGSKPRKPVWHPSKNETARVVSPSALAARSLIGRYQGLKYPKLAEKPPFLTVAEIKQRIEGLSNQAEYWDCAFLTLTDISALLEHVQKHARHDFVYLLFVFAPHTGARRSEMMRSQIQDLDFATGTIVIHEKKRARGKPHHPPSSYVGNTSARSSIVAV